jgi:hypothetical protein
MAWPQHRPGSEIPARIEEAVNAAVASHLETELGDRGLLLSADGLAAAAAEAAQWGTELLGSVIERCYPISARDQALGIEFQSDRDAARLAAALAFGAVTARALAPGEHASEPTSPVDLLCAIFNLGIGLIDGLCDRDAEIGGAVLELVQGQDLVGAAAEPRSRGWLRAVVPPRLADHTVAFTAEIVETFFETLHALRPDDTWLEYRRRLGAQLEAALDAERKSVVRSPEASAPDLIGYSRLTSVLPFQIIEALARGDHPATDRSAGTLLGEAVWRIDDLVDLCADAGSGALNGVLVGATEPTGGDVVAALERLLTSTDLTDAACEAADRLLAGLQLAGAQPRRSFLYFIQRYAGIAPGEAS